MEPKYKGTVKTVKADKGFAFLFVPEFDRDIFMHASTLPRGDFEKLQVGSTVECNVFENDRGFNAKNSNIYLN